MSKLLNLYSTLKKENPDILYLFHSGIFCVALDDDALTLSELFDFKLIDLNSQSIKCGFPFNKISHYSHLLNLNNINFKIIDPNEPLVVSNNASFYEPIIQEILNINFNELTFKDAFFKLQDIQEKLKNQNKTPQDI